jgi:hypothetical protein
MSASARVELGRLLGGTPNEMAAFIEARPPTRAQSHVCERATSVR